MCSSKHYCADINKAYADDACPPSPAAFEGLLKSDKLPFSSANSEQIHNFLLIVARIKHHIKHGTTCFLYAFNDIGRINGQFPAVKNTVDPSQLYCSSRCLWGVLVLTLLHVTKGYFQNLIHVKYMNSDQRSFWTQWPHKKLPLYLYGGQSEQSSIDC